MTEQLDLFWLNLNWAIAKYREKLQFNIAWMLPRWLVAMDVVRCAAHASTGKYAATDLSELTVVTALKRWASPNV